ncbi:pyridoxamine 5'-phosphate oxidase family protein [Mycolicibacterium sp.]|uniref:pyridoxamine 5'-phosphate oxidase family protein n=1 Tax=Mycolicibacterium sp. TaxID=2320850 RepID=UPI00355CF56A
MTGETVMTNENVRKIAEALMGVDTVMLTTVDARCNLVSRPMAVQANAFDGVLRLFAPRDSRCVANIAARATVNVSYVSAAASLSMAGFAGLVTDPDRVGAHWHRGLDRWFPNGPVGVSMIEVTVDEARLWRVGAPAAQPAAV